MTLFAFHQNCVVGDFGGAGCWFDWVDTAAVDDKLAVESTWYRMLGEVVAVQSVDKLAPKDYMSVDNGRLEKKWHEHLSLYHSSYWKVLPSRTTCSIGDQRGYDNL